MPHGLTLRGGTLDFKKSSFLAGASRSASKEVRITKGVPLSSEGGASGESQKKKVLSSQKASAKKTMKGQNEYLNYCKRTPDGEGEKKKLHF